MMGYELKVKKQTTPRLIDINRVYLQVFMGFGFLAFMPGQWVWETPLFPLITIMPPPVSCNPQSTPVV